jgi:hypothetical protein
MRYCRDRPQGRAILRFLDSIAPRRLKSATIRRTGCIALLTLDCLIVGCGGSGPAKLPSDLTPVSGSTPFAVGCNGAPQAGTLYTNSSVEPFVAVDPNDPSHLVGVWQQDRWSNSGSNGLLTGVSRDGGRNWVRASAPLSRCAGGNASNGGDYERASDPWVTFSPDGTAYQISVSFNNSDRGAGKAILVSRSTDGGSTWSDPIALARDLDVDVAVDKQTITADPRDARLVYAVWDRLTQLTNPNPAMVSGPTWFARLANDTWELARIIFDPGADAQTISNQIVVLPDGTLVNLFMLITNASSMTPERRVAIQRSTDKGVSWSAPVIIDRSLTVGVSDAKTHQRIRSGSIVPGIAADPVTGRLYVVWQDSRFSNGVRDGIAMSTSFDGGLIWSAPIQLNQSPNTPAFTPAIAISANGRVGVSYYDFRTDDPGNPNSLLTSYWLVTSKDGGATWEETAIGEAFDLRTAPVVDGYFVGDYEGLAADGESFVSFFSAATFPHVGNPNSIYFYSETR